MAISASKMCSITFRDLGSKLPAALHVKAYHRFRPPENDVVMNIKEENTNNCHTFSFKGRYEKESCFKLKRTHILNACASCSYLQTNQRYSFRRQLNSLKKTQSPLFKMTTMSQQPSVYKSSHTPTQMILESSPKSVQPYLRLIRFDKPIGET